MTEYIENKVDLSWDPYRTIFGLSKIGYTPPSAIGDIIDNSITANAKNIHVYIAKKNETSTDSRKNNVKEYLIVDDGEGMNENEIINALQLGSSNENYETNSLSKFGLGLKSAAFSQGETLEVISSKDKGGFRKYRVSLAAIKNMNAGYFATKEKLTQEDEDIISKNLTKGKGTIIRITDIKMVNHPSVKDTVNELEYKLGVIYYFFIKEDVKIIIHAHEKSLEIEPYDILFSEEADKEGKLDENEWDGFTTRWIEKSSEPVLLDVDSKICGTVEVTQLPHPPSFGKERNSINKKYKISASNYGYYVYRNKRLISWAERFSGIIPQDQDYYSFRGRILIDDTADEAFNIDVKKSSIVLSGEASSVLSDLSAEYKRKSKNAWKKAGQFLKEREGKEPNVAANRIVENVEEPESYFEKDEDEEELERRNNKDLDTKMKEKLLKNAIKEKTEKQGKEVTEKDVTKEDIEETLKGTVNPDVKKIFRVNNIDDNYLWEPYYDADHGQCVRINKAHRFSKLIFEDNYSNSDLQIIYEVLLLNFAQAEVKARVSKKNDGLNIEKVLEDYRYTISEYLTNLCRQKESELPPNNKEV